MGDEVAVVESDLAEGTVWSETGLDLPEDLNFEQWCEVMANTLRINRTSLWWVGDAFVYGETRFGDDAYQAVEDGYASETVRQAERISKEFPPRNRLPQLSWSHHREVLVVKDEGQRRELLEEARDAQLSRRELHEAAQAVKSGASPSSAVADAVRPEPAEVLDGPRDAVEAEDWTGRLETGDVNILGFHDVDEIVQLRISANVTGHESRPDGTGVVVLKVVTSEEAD